MKYLILFLALIFSSAAYATEATSQSAEKKSISRHNIENITAQVKEIDRDVKVLFEKTEEAKLRQLKLNENINDNYKLQKGIESSLKKLFSALESKNNEIKPLQIKLQQPTNYYIFALPAVTLFIVIAGTLLSIKTITIKSKESLDAINASNESQHKLNEKIIQAELERSREAIISHNRQKWINNLRDDVSKYLSTTTKLISDKSESGKGLLKRENIDELWLEFYKIQLLLNPSEDIHVKLINLLRELISSIDDTDKFTSIRSDIIDASQAILKHEWERVKKFE